jgi:hypothetical protein
VLTDFGDYHWMGLRMRDQHSEQWDAGYTNVRLYQDLLGTDPNNPSPGDPYPFVKHVATFGFIGSGEAEKCQPPVLGSEGLSCLAKVFLPGGEGLGPQRPGILLFKLDKEELIENLPVALLGRVAIPLARSSASDGAPEHVIRPDGGLWRSARQGESADGEFVGADFRRAFTPAGLTIKWIATSWLPGSIDIEHSDDGKDWQSAGTFPVAPPADPVKAATGANRWEETFPLPDVGAHRFWRVVARGVPSGNSFGMEFLRFDQRSN